MLGTCFSSLSLRKGKTFAYAQLAHWQFYRQLLFPKKLLEKQAEDCFEGTFESETAMNQRTIKEKTKRLVFFRRFQITEIPGLELSFKKLNKHHDCTMKWFFLFRMELIMWSSMEHIGAYT